MLSGCLGYFARFDATRAYAHLHTLPVFQNPDRLKVGHKPPLRTVIRITHAIPRSWPLITYVTEIRHFAVVIS